eukprot:TRINITY_DN12513_c0_g6_i2.p2 TRINITY_DN12513_c0_g6~~TRINITY_DN12513_c0_g6_i2.p2  ORF type:complete len:147 (+),score=11.47 TRINITY_DN12513_c0_g6_i2:2054-2494(+)
MECTPDQPTSPTLDLDETEIARLRRIHADRRSPQEKEWYNEMTDLDNRMKRNSFEVATEADWQLFKSLIKKALKERLIPKKILPHLCYSGTLLLRANRMEEFRAYVKIWRRCHKTGFAKSLPCWKEITQVFRLNPVPLHALYLQID